MKQIISLILISIWCFGNDLNLNDFSNLKCDKTLNNGFFEICYSYEHKAAIASYTKLLGPNMDLVNIKERDDFYDDPEIPKEFRTKDTDYIKKKLDRGHINGDASFDWSTDSLHSTYALSNIVPQYPNTNRHSYLNVEKEERAQAKALDYVEVRVDIEYNSGKKMESTDIPSLFNIIIYNKDKNFKECFSVKNDNIQYELNQIKVDCK